MVREPPDRFTALMVVNGPAVAAVGGWTVVSGSDSDPWTVCPFMVALPEVLYPPASSMRVAVRLAFPDAVRSVFEVESTTTFPTVVTVPFPDNRKAPLAVALRL